MLKKWKLLVYLLSAAFLLTSCSQKSSEETASSEVAESQEN